MVLLRQLHHLPCTPMRKVSFSLEREDGQANNNTGGQEKGL